MTANDKILYLRIFSVALLLPLLVGLAGCGKNFSRAQFTQLAMNKSEAEVERGLGKPQLVSESKPLKWTYYRKTYDATNQNKDDYSATLTFAPDATGQQKVVDVDFSSAAR